MSQLHVVFGAGQIGAGLALHLLARGHRVRVVRASGRPVGQGIEVVQADAMDRDAAIAAAAGADVVYHCLNPTAYTAEAWQAEFPAMGEAIIAATRAAGARLVCLDNVYGYGITDEARREDTPMRAAGPKGRVRIAWDARLREAGEAGLRWTAGRAGDFFGPGTGDQSLIAMSVVRGLGRGRPALMIGRAGAPHSFSCTTDVIAGLAALGEAEDDVEGRAWHLPVHTVAPRDLVRALARAQGRRGWGLTLPAWLIRGLAPLVPLFRDLSETLYQWDRPFRIDDSAFHARFPGVGASFDEVVARTAAATTVDDPVRGAPLSA